MKYNQTIIITLGKKHPSSLKYLMISLKQILKVEKIQLIFVYRKDYKEYEKYTNFLQDKENVLLFETKDNDCKKICKLDLVRKYVEGKYVRIFDPDDLYIRNIEQENEINSSNEDLLIENILYLNDFLLSYKGT
jgi:hypothetical protein